MIPGRTPLGATLLLASCAAAPPPVAAAGRGAGEPSALPSAPAATPPLPAAPRRAADVPSAALQRLSQARLEAASRTLELLEARWKTGGVSGSDYLAGSARWYRAHRESGVVGEALARAAEAHLARAKRHLELAEGRYRNGAIDELDLSGAKEGLAEAEFWAQQARDQSR